MKTNKKQTRVNPVNSLESLYGKNVFNLKTMREYLSEKTFKSLAKTINEGHSIDASIANEVADAMKKWALSKGATHFTHWFQPLTGTTAEKHDSFIWPDSEGGVELKFSGKELIQGEPDASSFPSGGLRATFEARGYTAWDPTSPAFIKEGKNSTTLCIPTAFYSYHGDALDKKTPLLRSVSALSKQICRLAELFGIKSSMKRAYATLGPEQEYFLIDASLYMQRLDLIQTGRTLFGKKPGKHQQMEDHYFGSIKPRILAFMEDLDKELWKLGIPAKTRHNEVCPAQFEIAPIFEEQNLAVDHNMLTMETLKTTAEKHGLVCLLHEKPFAGVNGSGKHNNWSVVGPDGKNWLSPGDNPHENAKFLTIICALMKAIDTHAGLLRTSVASAGNDHRLGANEAPPAIMSIFLGDELTDIIEQIGLGGSPTSKKSGSIEIGVSSLPKFPKDATDRNRTSPFAFTGNKFEFRAVGSNQSCAGSNVILNTIVAEALDEICSKIEKSIESGKNFNDSLQEILKNIASKHKRILFNGDNYTEEWHKEAEKRGLPNLRKTPECLDILKQEASLKLLEKYGVLSRQETNSRYEIYKEQYVKTILIEASVALTMAKTQIVPAALRYQNEVSLTVENMKQSGLDHSAVMEVSSKLCTETNKVLAGIKKLEASLASHSTDAMLSDMLEIRDASDKLEDIIPDDLWPLPSYAELLFLN